MHSIAFQCKNIVQLAIIKLNGDPLPWKDKVNHLGFSLTSNCSSAFDIMEKRAAFISNVYSLNKEFSVASPENKLRLYSILWFKLLGLFYCRVEEICEDLEC